jgi:predicted N-acetyltransferase YhbS
MKANSFDIRPINPADAATIETLHEAAFGPGRFARTAYRLREDVPPDPLLSFAAVAAGVLVGSVYMTPIRIGGTPALLLGPLAVRPDWAGKGVGRALVRRALDAARAGGHKLVMLVGDLPYYGPLGFQQIAPGRITLPGPVDPARILVSPLTPDALDELGGRAARWV